jgi:hypothetical protein
MNEDERVECVSHCRYVDEVISNSPWCLTQEFIDKHQIDYVTHGEDLSVDEHGNDAYKWVKDQGRFVVVKRTEGISTTDLILRIIKDYDVYVKRNLSRGISSKEMNLSFFHSLKHEKSLGWKIFFFIITIAIVLFAIFSSNLKLFK